MGKTNTLAQVADAAGVSLITASRALRGVGRVAPETRERVLAAAAQLDYTPHVLAQKLRGSRSNVIGVFVNGFVSLVTQELLADIDREAQRQGYDLIVFNAQNFDDRSRAGTSEMLRTLCDGLILIMPNANDGLLGKLERARGPCVLVGFEARPVELPVVVGGNRAAARGAVEHLLALGHRKIAFIAGTHYTGQSAERQRGYEEALRAAGIAVRPEWIRPGEFTDASGVAQGQAILALPDRPTAIFAASDAMAFGAMEAIQAAGLRVPEDISLVGFDDVVRAALVQPTLTTVRQPFGEMAVRAVTELVHAIKGGQTGAIRVELTARLVVRGSTGPAPLT